MMIVISNNEKLEISEGSHLIGLLEIHNIKDFNGLAIAVNNEIIPKKNWNTYLLQQNDQITIITATQGG